MAEKGENIVAYIFRAEYKKFYIFYGAGIKQIIFFCLKMNKIISGFFLDPLTIIYAVLILNKR